MKEEESFEEKRERLNELVKENGNLEIKRFFNLDNQVYEEGALAKKTKELLGLVASLSLRCDECIEYHLERCYEEDVTDEEMMEALSIGLVVGGSTAIPHLREAVEKWINMGD
ncbi:MAG: carboxymuconolactone decarboxylase family protein [Candidatus Thermoplasmatota archaeon]